MAVRVGNHLSPSLGNDFADRNKMCKRFSFFSIVTLRLAMMMSTRFDSELHPIVTSAPSENERSPPLYTLYAPRLSEINLRKPQCRSVCANIKKNFIQG